LNLENAQRNFPLEKGSCEKIREGEAPAEPLGGKMLIQNGSAGASPSHGA